MATKIEKGIYDSPSMYSIKIISVITKKGKKYAEMYFTNNPNYGKSHFGLEGKHLTRFMKSYKKR